MKKILISTMLLVMISVLVFAAGLVNVPEKWKVWRNGVEEKFIYFSTDTVENGTPEIFKIESRNPQGKISEIKFASSSDDWRVLISEDNGSQERSTDTIIDFSNTELVYAPVLPNPVTYVNRDGTGTAFLYATIIVDSGDPTGNWTLTTTYLRY